MDEIYIIYKGKKVWPKDQKFMKIDVDDTLPIGMKMVSAEKMAVSKVDKRKVYIRTGMIMGKNARKYFTKAVAVMVKPRYGGPTASRKRQA